MRGRRHGPLTVATIAEHLAWEVGKDATDILHSRRAYDRDLRCVTVFLARDVGRITLAAIADAIGQDIRTVTSLCRRAERLERQDAEFQRLVAIVADVLPMARAA